MTDRTGTAVDITAVGAASTDGVAMFDDGTCVYANDELAALHGRDAGDDLRGLAWAELYERPDGPAPLGVAREDGCWEGELVVGASSGDRFRVQASLRATGDGVLAVVDDAADRADRADRVADLQRRVERYETIIETVEDGIYALDEELRFSFVNDAIRDVTGMPRDEILGTPATDLFDDETQVAMAEDIRERVLAGDTSTGTIEATLDADGPRQEMEARYRLYPEPGPDGEFRGSVGVVRDVTERTERERLLERQRSALETLNHVNEVMLAVVRELFDTRSRSGVERAVCERVVAADLYEFAWIGELDPGGDRLVRRTAAGIDGEPGAPDGERNAGAGERVDADDGAGGPAGPDTADAGSVSAVPLSRPEDRPGSAASGGPFARAFETDAVQVVGEPGASPAVAPFRTAGVVQGGSLAVVPLWYGETTHGVLVVHAARPDAFGERERTSLGTLGQAVGFALDAIGKHRLLFAESVLELELAVDDPEAFFVDAAEDLGGRIALDGYVATRSDAWLVYLAVDAAIAEAFVDGRQRDARVEQAWTVREGEADHVVVVRMRSPLLDEVAALGGRVTDATVEEGSGRVVVEVPPATDVRAAVDQWRTAFPSVELVAYRELERAPTPSTTADARPTDDLTERQTQALEAAYLGGYFEWPRESTAEDVAASLGVSRPTFHAHLRKAERKLLAAFFERPDRPTGQ